jgi:hypothetical protein
MGYQEDLITFFEKTLIRISKTANLVEISQILSDIKLLNIELDRDLGEIIVDAFPVHDIHATSAFINSLTRDKLNESGNDGIVILKLVTADIAKNGYINMLNGLLEKRLLNRRNLIDMYQHAAPPMHKRLVEIAPELESLMVLEKASEKDLEVILKQGVDGKILLQYLGSLFNSDSIMERLPLIVPYIDTDDIRVIIINYITGGIFTYPTVEAIIRYIPGIEDFKLDLLTMLAGKIDPYLFLQVLDPSYPKVNQFLLNNSQYSLEELINIYKQHPNDFIAFVKDQTDAHYFSML